MQDARKLRPGDGSGPAPSPGAIARLFRRVALAARRELGALHFRLMVADLLVRLMPQTAFERARAFVYRLAGVGIGPHTLIAGRLELVGFGPVHRRLHVGSTSYINTHLYADLSTDVFIGDRVAIGNHVVLLTAGHEIGPSIHRAATLRLAPIVIGDGAWIGARVTVLPGARIGAGSIVAAGSIVTGDIPPNVLAAGIPARVKRNLDA